MRIHVVHLENTVIPTVLVVCDETNIETCSGSNSFLVHDIGVDRLTAAGRGPALPVNGNQG